MTNFIKTYIIAAAFILSIDFCNATQTSPDSHKPLLVSSSTKQPKIWKPTTAKKELSASIKHYQKLPPLSSTSNSESANPSSSTDEENHIIQNLQHTENSEDPSSHVTKSEDENAAIQNANNISSNNDYSSSDDEDYF